jgi:hypothetical protein
MFALDLQKVSKTIIMSQHTHPLNLDSSQTEGKIAHKCRGPCLSIWSHVCAWGNKEGCVLDRAVELLHDTVMNINWSGPSEININKMVSSVACLEFTQPPIEWVPGALSPRVKRPGHEADHSLPASTQVKKIWIYTSTPPYAFMK